jgi:hypothetical protein
LINEKEEKEYAVALDGHRLKYFYSTTNQKHAALIDKGMKERCEW